MYFCVNIKTELVNNLFGSQVGEEVEREIETKMHQAVQDLKDVKMESVEEIKHEEKLIIENNYDETYDNPADASCEEDINEDQD